MGFAQVSLGLYEQKWEAVVVLVYLKDAGGVI